MEATDIKMIEDRVMARLNNLPGVKHSEWLLENESDYKIERNWHIIRCATDGCNAMINYLKRENVGNGKKNLCEACRAKYYVDKKREREAKNNEYIKNKKLEAKMKANGGLIG